MDKGNNGTLKLGTSAGVDSGRRESLPDNGLANVGGNEKRDTAAKTVALLEELIEKNDDNSSSEKLNNEKNADTSSKIGWLTVKTSKDENASLTERDDDGKKLLSSLVQLTVGLQVEVDVNEVGSSKELRSVLEAPGQVFFSDS